MENDLSSSWTVGKILDVVLGRDGQVRRATVQYQNPGEEFNVKRTTDRAARSLIRLFHIDDQNWAKDMAEAEKVLELLQNDSHQVSCSICVADSDSSRLGVKLKSWLVTHKPGCRSCCCNSHCKLESHSKAAVVPGISLCAPKACYDALDLSWIDELDYEEMLVEKAHSSCHDGLTGLIVQTKLDLAEDVASAC